MEVVQDEEERVDREDANAVEGGEEAAPVAEGDDREGPKNVVGGPEAPKDYISPETPNSPSSSTSSAKKKRQPTSAMDAPKPKRGRKPKDAFKFTADDYSRQLSCDQCRQRKSKCSRDVSRLSPVIPYRPKTDAWIVVPSLHELQPPFRAVLLLLPPPNGFSPFHLLQPVLRSFIPRLPPPRQLHLPRPLSPTARPPPPPVAPRPNPRARPPRLVALPALQALRASRLARLASDVLGEDSSRHKGDRRVGLHAPAHSWVRPRAEDFEKEIARVSSSVGSNGGGLSLS